MKLLCALVLAVVVIVLCDARGASAGDVGRARPQGPARVRFARDFPRLVDHEWKFRIGGFGGIRKLARLHHVPVIFVHGNRVDHDDWYPVRDQFLKTGWTLQEMYALSYDGLGGNNGGGLYTPNPERDAEHAQMGANNNAPITSDDVNVPDLYDFVRAVRKYTGSRKFSIVAHSLGVTVARKMLKVHPELRRDLVAFVGIAGANHGTSFCPPGSESMLSSCDEIAAGTPWLAWLNGPNGSDETYKPARWLTIYDGTPVGDIVYLGTYAQSPVLEGATNLAFPITLYGAGRAPADSGYYHNDLRMAPEMVTVYRSFLERAERPFLSRLRRGPRARS
jgi:pimeloyl-ACP methyl ester carboxylesterase